MWDTLKGKAMEAMETVRPSLPSLPFLPSLSALPSLSSLSTPSGLIPAFLSPPVKEPMEDTPEQEEPESDSPVIRVFQKMIRYTKQFISIAFIPLLSLLMASFIANEMIVYPAPIRLVFFLFTLFICITTRFIAILLGLFYLCKWGYDYYVNEMSDLPGPKRLIMPTPFALLPLTTKTYTNRFFNWLASPFQYGETWSKSDAEELKRRMELYQESLKEAFPYVEAIKNQDPFSQQLEKIAKGFAELHKAPLAPPPAAPLTPTIQNANAANVARFAALPTGPLPAVIEPAPTPAPTAQASSTT